MSSTNESPRQWPFGFTCICGFFAVTMVLAATVGTFAGLLGWPELGAYALAGTGAVAVGLVADLLFSRVALPMQERWEQTERTDMIREAAERTARADVLKDASTGGPEHALKNRGLSFAELSHAEEELFVLTYQRAVSDYEREKTLRAKRAQEGQRHAERIAAIRTGASEIPTTDEERWEAVFNSDEHQEVRR